MRRCNVCKWVGVLVTTLGFYSFPNAQVLRTQVPLARVAPAIDGQIGNDEWKDAVDSGRWERFGGSTPVVHSTSVRLLTDQNYLYFLVRSSDSDASRIVSNETQRGSKAVLGDDSIRIHIDSQGAGIGYSTFAFNTNGTQYTELEGGSSGNWKWAGDWKVVTRRRSDGYDAEVAIPWKLLKHPKGADSIGLVVMRLINRESNPVSSPPLPANLQTTKNLAQFMGRFQTPRLPDAVSAPVILPYTYFTAGAVNGSRVGVDAKFAISSGLTALATLFPDFQNVENDVNTLAFTYNEQAIADRRPFFAEGSEFMPERDLFYSRRISTVDSGVKVVGRNGNQTFGSLVTTSMEGPANRTTSAFRYDKAYSPLSSVGLAFVTDNLSGASDSRVARVSGDWGHMIGRQRYAISTRVLQSTIDGHASGAASDVSASWRDIPGRINAKIGLSQLDRGFQSPLGVLIDKDRRGSFLNVFQTNRFDKGVIETYTVDYLKKGAVRQSTGGFFYDQDLLVLDIVNRRGMGLNMGVLSQRRTQELGGDRNVDRVTHIMGLWNKRSLFSTGGVSYDSGKQNGSLYRLAGLEQGLLFSRDWSGKLSLIKQDLGSTVTRQTILTTTLRLDSERTVSARLVTQTGTGNAANVGGQVGSNVYFAYAQRTRSGTDYFLIVGDPNKANTRGQITFKAAKVL